VTNDQSSMPVWYYAEEGRPVGPFHLVELKQRLACLPDPPDQFIWRDGMADWQRAGVVAELAPTAAYRASPRGAGAQRPGTRVSWRGNPQLTKIFYGLGSVLAAILGVAIGIETGREFGLNFWIPVICLSVSFLVVRALKVPLSFAPVLGVGVGQWLLFLSVMAVLFIMGIDQTLSWQLVAENVLLGTLVFWLWFAQSSAAVIALAVYELVGLMFNGYASVTEGLSVSLVIHIVLRLCALGGAYYALRTLVSHRVIEAVSSPQH
jgi:hypothetical protein